MISIIKPDIFLVSGGGNDILGNKKIGFFATEVKREICFPENFKDIDNHDLSELQEGYQYLTDEFFSYMNILQGQYTFLFRSIRKKYSHMPIITQGYDAIMPHSKIDVPFFSIPYWHQHLIHKILGSGRWIELAFRNAKIYDRDIMSKIVKTMIFLFNEKLMEIGQKIDFVYHIDSRGLNNSKDWYDEIHPKIIAFIKLPIPTIMP